MTIPETPSGTRRLPLRLLLAGFALLCILPRLHYLDVPFERDEGAYAYVSDVIDAGGIPYADAFDHKPPGVYYLYNLSFKAFGHGVRAARLAAGLFVFASTLLCYAFVKRLTGNTVGGLVAMALWGLASSSPAYAGFGANTEVFLTPFLVGGCLLLLADDLRPRTLFLSGLLFGFAVMIKQVAAPVALCAFSCAALRRPRSAGRFAAALLPFAAGSLLPLALTVLYFWARGALGPFWTGFYSYNASYVAGPTLLDALSFLRRALDTVLRHDPVIWFASLLGLAMFLLRAHRPYHKAFLLSVLAGAALGVSMGKYFYPHYFVVILPFLAIAAGAGYFSPPAGARRAAILAVAGSAVALALATNFPFLKMSTAALVAYCYGGNPFYQSVGLGRYLKEQSSPGAKAYIVGSEPQIFFYSGLKAATRFFYFYPMTLNSRLTNGFRVETAAALHREPPDYLLLVNAPSSHFIRPERNRQFLSYLLQPFLSYKLVAVSTFGSDYPITDASALGNRRLVYSMSSILVFKKGTLLPGGQYYQELRSIVGT